MLLSPEGAKSPSFQLRHTSVLTPLCYFQLGGLGKLLYQYGPQLTPTTILG